ncbi:MAG: hypothetical protein ABI120_15245, partial [Gemmatimonadaceae bacterium]
MKNIITNQARVSVYAAVAASALLVTAPFASAFAQTAQPELRWRALTGCWVPEESTVVGANAVNNTMVCIAPVAGTASADVATIVNKQVLHTDRIDASGQRIVKTVDKCPGWETATWSDDKNRLLLRSEFDCGDNVKVKGSGVFGIDGDGNWVQVQGTSVGTNAGARVVRYRAADVALAEGTVLKDSAMVQTVAAAPSSSLGWFRQLSGHAPTVAAVLEVSKNVDESVAQAWLSEFGKPEKLSAKELVAMSDAGMPSNLIDMMVAMSYPERFQLQARSESGVGSDARPINANFNTRGNGISQACFDDLDRFGSLGYGSRLDQLNCNRYGSRYQPYGMYPFSYLGFGGLGYGYGNYGYGGYGTNYYGNSPIVIVTRGSDEPARPRGKAVVGGGYTRQPTSSGDGGSSPRSTGSSGNGSSSSGASGAWSPASSSSSGSSTAEPPRTAKPRTP